MPNGAEEALGELRRPAHHAVGVGLQVRRRLIVNRARSGLRFQVKGIVAGETNLDQAPAALHGVEPRADEIAVKKDISRSGEKADVGQRRLENLCTTADRLEIQLAGALRAHQRASRGLNNDVAGDFLQVDVAGDTFERHVAHNLLDVNKSRLSPELQFRFFRHGQLQTSSRIRRLRRGVQNRGGDVDAVTGLFHVKANLVGGLAGDDVDFPIFPGLHFDAAVGDIVDYDNRTRVDREMLFDVLARGCLCGGNTGAEKSRRAKYRQHTAFHI